MCAWIEESFIQTQDRVGFFISIPNRGVIDQNVVGSLLSIRVPGTYGRPLYGLEVGQPIDISRNIACSKALQANARYLVFIDSDIAFPPDTLERLLSYRLPVVGAAYRARGPPYAIVANGNSVDPAVLKDPNTDLMKVDNIGMGFTLIDMRVIKNLAMKMEWRCFLDHTKQIKQEVARYSNQQAIDQGYKCSICQKLLVAKFFDYRSGKANSNAISEDFYFCKLCNDNQIPIHLSTKTFVKHLTQQMLDIEGFYSNLQSVGNVD